MLSDHTSIKNLVSSSPHVLHHGSFLLPPSVFFGFLGTTRTSCKMSESPNHTEMLSHQKRTKPLFSLIQTETVSHQ